MIINTISDIKKIVFEIVLFTLLLFALLYFLLTRGIEIPSVHFDRFNIKKLYLKLDKKLILSIDRISLPSTIDQRYNLPTNIEYINIIGKYFQKIDIKHLQTQKDEITVSYNNGIFQAKGKNFDAQLHIHYNPFFHRLEVKIDKYYNKRYNLFLNGILRVYKNDRIFSNFRYNFEGIKGTGKFLLIANELTFRIDSTFFNNRQLRKIFSHFHLHPLIKAWSYEKIRAKEYKLLYAKGRINLKKIDPYSIEAKAIGKKVKVWFQQGIDPVSIKQVTLLYKNDNLSFYLTKPRYHDKDLTGSKVTIYHLTKKNSFIDVDLKTVSALDQEIKRVVASYGITLPLLQTKGTTDATLLIRIRFRDGNVALKGEFYTQNSLFDLDNTQLSAKRVLVKLVDKKIILKNSLISLPSVMSATVNGNIDLQKKVGKLYLKEGSIDVTYGMFQLIKIPHYNDVLTIDLNQKNFILPKLNLRYSMKSKTLEINHLEDLKRFSPLLQKIDPETAFLHYDLKTKRVIVKFTMSDSPFFLKEKPLENFTLSINLINKKAVLNNIASIEFNQNLKIFLHDVMIDLTKVHKKEERDQKIEINLQNVILCYKKHQLLVQKGDYEKNHQRFYFNAKVADGFVKMKKERILQIEATDLTAETLNKLIGKNIFSRGNYVLKAQGDKKNIEGTLLITNGYLKELKLINNFFAFLNTVPALMTLSNPGYDKTGLLIKHGKIDFIYTADKLIFSNIKFRSISMDIVGTGIIDLNTSTIEMKLDLQTLKNVAKIIKNIPLAGYILLGKDGSISTSIEIYGQLNDPKFRSLLPSQTIKMPFNIIKRTLELPFKLFE